MWEGKFSSLILFPYLDTQCMISFHNGQQVSNKDTILFSFWEHRIRPRTWPIYILSFSLVKVWRVEAKNPSFYIASLAFILMQFSLL